MRAAAASSARACRSLSSRRRTLCRRKAACTIVVACLRCACTMQRRQTRCMHVTAATTVRRRRAACNCSVACMQRVRATRRRQTRCMRAALVAGAAACGDAVGEPSSLRRAVGPVRSPCAFRCWHVPCCQMPSVPSGLRGAGSTERPACASCQRLAARSRIGSVANARCAVRGTCVPAWRRAGTASAASASLAVVYACHASQARCSCREACRRRADRRRITAYL